MSALKVMSETSENHLVAPRPIRPHREPETGEAGFTVIEVMVAIALFAIVAVGFAGTMSSALGAQLHARIKTTANQLATRQVERARALAYDDVRTSGEAPRLEPTEDVVVGSTTYRVKTDVSYRDDRVEGTLHTGTDYKQLVVTVTTPGSATTLARLETYVAPSTQPNLLEATVDAHVTDTTKSGPGVAGVTVDLVGPSGTLHGTTDSTGSVLFPGLQPTASGETYRIEVTSAPAGWRYDPAAQVASDSSGPVLATQTQRFTLVLTRTTP
jgi:prepilin-type N-terminal cleavage/methylation domain-containing protein